VALIAIYAYLILVEYFHDRIVRKRALTDLSPGELDDALTNALRDELMPYAPIDKIVERRQGHQRPGVLDRLRKRSTQHLAETPQGPFGQMAETPQGPFGQIGQPDARVAKGGDER
jgi:hypothetical protein